MGGRYLNSKAKELELNWRQSFQMVLNSMLLDLLQKVAKYIEKDIKNIANVRFWNKYIDHN